MHYDEVKRLPDSNTIPVLSVRPVELALFMSDLINVIIQTRDPNSDELIARYLFKRFDDEIKKTEAEFQQEFLLTVAQYAKQKVDAHDTAFNPDEVRNILQGKRSSRLTKTGSVLLSSESFIECLQKARKRLNSYTNPE
ncbi:unnamed protein product [Rotaria magnacalcarata]|uniref:Uncharacterized protein n=1 Tax=Rotaria magnacalcarata TaxID=392030 RepID=A0A819TP31_9BILA|nr:unnamed protein product [Rotaria magnacalcarata]CAF2144089.1 unnamed protein product [Rotaria magnacalcarata]CAF4082903.1 unnamed protein product [Rotaria magnacalcarata]CAF4136890.1 unnamed protein product [Rotaria magnacalcarata]